MNFFKQVDLDWMGKAKYFFGLSGLLLLAGVALHRLPWRPILWY